MSLKLLVVSLCTTKFNIKTSVVFPHKYVPYLLFSVILTLQSDFLQRIYRVTFVVESQLVFSGVGKWNISINFVSFLLLKIASLINSHSAPSDTHRTLNGKNPNSRQINLKLHTVLPV